MGWVYLLIASAFEIGFATALKAADGFTRPVPSLVVAVCTVFGLYFLSRAMQTLPLGTAYAMWTGIGAVGIVTIGILFHGESADPLRLILIAVIISALVGLKLTSPH